jgi:hypothetical protein
MNPEDAGRCRKMPDGAIFKRALKRILRPLSPRGFCLSIPIKMALIG